MFECTSKSNEKDIPLDFGLPPNICKLKINKILAFSRDQV